MSTDIDSEDTEVFKDTQKERRHYYFRTHTYPIKSYPYGTWGWQLWRVHDSITLDIWAGKKLYVIALCWYY